MFSLRVLDFFSWPFSLFLWEWRNLLYEFHEGLSVSGKRELENFKDIEKEVVYLSLNQVQSSVSYIQELEYAQHWNIEWPRWTFGLRNLFEIFPAQRMP